MSESNSHPAPAQKVVPMAEPVAWRRPHLGTSGYQVTFQQRVADLWALEGLRIEPLYLAAQPILAQDAKDARSESVYLAGGAGGNVHAPGPTIVEQIQPFRDYVRAVERIAFEMPAPNRFTPRLVEASIQIGYTIAAILSSEQDQAGGGRGV